MMGLYCDAKGRAGREGQKAPTSSDMWEGLNHHHVWHKSEGQGREEGR
jgi:hypothetical protein